MLPWRHGLAHREGDLMDLDLRDKVFLVTGAAAGLGLATAGILLAGGARVVISCRTRHAVDKAAASSTACAAWRRDPVRSGRRRGAGKAARVLAGQLGCPVRQAHRYVDQAAAGGRARAGHGVHRQAAGRAGQAGARTGP